jgi:hypothetical protein
MTTNTWVPAVVIGLSGLHFACGSDGDSADSAAGGSSASGGSSGSSGTGGSNVCDEAPDRIDAYLADHPGADADINQKTADELLADPDASWLMALCGADQRPVIPKLAWEYGGNDHAWINPEDSALGYCVYTPVSPGTAHWSYDENDDHVEADVSIVCPDLNPCKGETGADQVMSCLGDESNVEILVDTASYDDGQAAGYDLSEASTDLYLLEPGGGRVHLYLGL